MSSTSFIRRHRWRFLKLMPEMIRHQVIRRMFRIDYDLPDDYEFKLADTLEELIAALKLLHENYVETGLMNPTKSQVRVTKYHFLPTTSVLIAKHKGEVIGTVTLIQDSPFGLPVDASWDYSAVRKKKSRLCEVSSLAVKREYQKKNGPLLFALLKFMWEYVYEYIKVDALVISTHPRVSDFYKALFLYQSVDQGRVVRYDFVNGNEGRSLWQDVNRAEEDMYRTYGKAPKERNLYYYFFCHRFNNFIYPPRDFHIAADPVWNPTMLQNFFQECPDIYLSLSPNDKSLLRSTYYFDDFDKVFGPASQWKYVRSSARFPVHCPAMTPKGEAILTHASRHGFQIHHSASFTQGEKIVLEVELAPGKKTSLEARIVWVSERAAGAQILETSRAWEECIEYFEARLRKNVS